MYSLDSSFSSDGSPVGTVWGTYTEEDLYEMNVKSILVVSKIRYNPSYFLMSS